VLGCTTRRCTQFIFKSSIKLLVVCSDEHRAACKWLCRPAQRALNILALHKTETLKRSAALCVDTAASWPGAHHSIAAVANCASALLDTATTCSACTSSGRNPTSL
jgi:hypothetical protein